MMKKKICFSLIIITVSIVALVVCWHKFYNASKNPNLIMCVNHIDLDYDMACDNCGKIFSQKYELSEKEVKTIDETGVVTKINGNMPEESKLLSKTIQKKKAVQIAKEHSLNVNEEDILLAYDMSIEVENKKYQPMAYNEEVSVNISNLEIDQNKSYAVLHIKDDGRMEVLDITYMDENQITFNIKSFSTYMVITVNSYNISFSQDSVYKATASNGEEVNAGDAYVRNNKL